MKLNQKTRRLVFEAKIIFENYRNANGYKPNKEERAAILRNNGFVNPERIAKHWDEIDARLEHLAEAIRKEVEV